MDRRMTREPIPDASTPPEDRSTERATLLSLSLAELEARVVELGGQPFHARIAREQVLDKGVLEYAAMTALPARLRERLAGELPVLCSREVARSVAADGTTKLLLELPAHGGREATIETVHMPSLYVDEAGESAGGATLCVSTQVGCPVRCPFCASGLSGLTRNLEAHEIVEQ